MGGDPVKPEGHPRAIWIDQSTRRTDGDWWVCGDCGIEWPRGLIGPPFEGERCRECGGLLTGVYRIYPGSGA
jgi:hypothetical protein